MPDKEEQLAEIWGLEDSSKMTADERIARIEAAATKHCEEGEKRRAAERERLRNSREYADSRKDHQIKKEKEMINGQDTNSRRTFVRPQTTIFGFDGKSNVFKSTEKRLKLDRYLRKNVATVSTQDRNAYMGALECFKDKRSGTLDMGGVKRMNRLLRTGEIGGDKKVSEAFAELKEKGIIKNARDLRNIVSRGTMRKMGAAFLQRDDQESISPRSTSGRPGGPENPLLSRGDRGSKTSSPTSTRL
ncbi:MAG: hypothetical protein WCQ96_00035 [Patescibacteria group bacterium]